MLNYKNVCGHEYATYALEVFQNEKMIRISLKAKMQIYPLRRKDLNIF
jgi:hypothetical protein